MKATIAHIAVTLRRVCDDQTVHVSYTCNNTRSKSGHITSSSYKPSYGDVVMRIGSLCDPRRTSISSHRSVK